MAVLRILGRITLVGLFICTLVVVALAQENADQPPAVAVDDQTSVNNTVIVRQVNAPQAAFLVIQRDLVGIPGPIIGQVSVPVGMTENVVIPLTEAVEPGNLLYAALYIDAGQAGIFEVPGADAPFILNDQTIAQPFSIAAASSEQSTQLTQQAPITLTATSTATAFISPLASPTPTLVVSTTVAATPQDLQVQITPTTQLPDLQTPVEPAPQNAPLGATPTAVVPIQATVDAAEAQAIATSQAQPALPVVQPTQQPAPPRLPTQQPPARLSPTPALMPVTGASATARLPVTFLIGALALGLFVGGNNLRQRLCRW